MPLNIKNIKNNSNINLDENGNYAKNAREKMEDLVDKDIPSYYYLDVKNAFEGMQSELNTLSKEPTKFNKNFPIADGVVHIPDTLMVGKAKHYEKKEYDKDGNATGNLEFKGIKLEVIDGKTAMALLTQCNDDFPSFEKVLRSMCTFDVIVSDTDSDLEDGELRRKYVGEFVQFLDFYIIPKWYSYTNKITEGSYSRLEPNAYDVTILSNNKK